MTDVNRFFELLKSKGIVFYTGVPDSNLNRFCNLLLKLDKEDHIIAANEGNAIAIAAGHYFATGKPSLVYMQNSGLGNAVNPLVSLADRSVYGVPMVLIIGWRGQPGSGDWVQHERQGKVTVPFLNEMDIPNCVLRDDSYEEIGRLIDIATDKKTPVAIVVPKGELDGDKSNIINNDYPLSRREAMEIVLDALPADTYYLASTGRLTRELFFLRKDRNESSKRDFLNVGAMGHTLSIAVGMAMARPTEQFVVFDGDGASIMHMGGMAIATSAPVSNLIHIVLNNGAHESVGGQPTAAYDIDLTAVARALGYETVDTYVSDKEHIVSALKDLIGKEKAAFLEIRICKGLKKPLPPLDFDHKEAIRDLMMELNG